MNFLNDSALISLPCSRNSFTWCTNRHHETRIYKQLDRVVVNAPWLSLYPLASLNNFLIISSNHGPICLTIDLVNKKTN